MLGSSEAVKKALAIKNGIVSLHDHAEPLEGEVGLAIITRAQLNSVTQFFDKEIAEAFCGPWDSNANGCNFNCQYSIEYRLCCLN